MQDSNKRQAAEPKLRVLYAVKRWNHHTASGGYDALVRALDSEVVRRRTDKSFLRRAVGFAWRKLTPSRPYLLDYRFEDWLSELYILWQSWYKRPDVVHVLYGDEQLDLLLRWRRLLRCPLVVTFHLPPYRVRERFEESQKELLSGIDMAVVVATSQLESMGKWLGLDHVAYVPHGIDTGRFCPGESINQSETVRFLTVGHHMRDWQSLDKIIVECHVRNLPVRFDMVCSEHQLEHSRALPNVDVHSGVSEEQLINFYREADALLLPLREATANNSTLEALACGTPVISTMVGGIPDYVDETCGWLYPKHEVDRIVTLIEEIVRCREVANGRRAAARKKGLTFSWNCVASQMNAIYDAVVTHRYTQCPNAEVA
jgi:glycosyltransferase involved in cell wall biosynthesis